MDRKCGYIGESVAGGLVQVGEAGAGLQVWIKSMDAFEGAEG